MTADEAKIQTRRMWPNGPLRLWSPERHGNFIPYAKGGYAGRYCCDDCLEPCAGVYRVIHASKWLCGPCKRALATRVLAEGLRPAAEIIEKP